MICRDIGAASALLSTLANPNRLAIVCLLLEGERSVMTLEATLGIRQPTLSQQLGILTGAGILTRRRTGRHAYYRVADARAAKIVDALRTMYRDLVPAAAILAPEVAIGDRADLALAMAQAKLAEFEAM